MFAGIVRDINAATGKATTNSLKKNVFPDLDRMGLLERCNPRGEPISGRQSVASARLSVAGKDFATSDKLIERYNFFTKGVDELFSGRISEIAELIYYSNYRAEKISI